MQPKLVLGIVIAASLLSSCGGGGNSSTALPPGAAGGSGVGGGPSATIPKRYAVTDLGTGVVGNTGLIPTAVNDAGEVVGGAGTVSTGCISRCGSRDAWVFRNGSLHLLPLLPTFGYGSAFDINNSGVIAGSMQQEQSPYLRPAVLWNPDGTIVNLGTGIPVAGLPGVSATAYSISDTGIIAGDGGDAAYGEFQPLIFDGHGGASNPCGQYNGFTVQGYFIAVNNNGLALANSRGILDAVVTCPPLKRIDPPPGAPYSPTGNDINDNGDVVGWYFAVPFLRHAFLNHKGVATDLGTLFPASPTSESSALAINDAGVIVGISFESQLVNGLLNPRGFVYAGGKMIDLNTLLPPECANWTVVEATDISESGKIAAEVYVGGFPNGREHAVLLTPVQ